MAMRVTFAGNRLIGVEQFQSAIPDFVERAGSNDADAEIEFHVGLDDVGVERESTISGSSAAAANVWSIRPGR